MKGKGKCFNVNIGEIKNTRGPECMTMIHEILSSINIRVLWLHGLDTLAGDCGLYITKQQLKYELILESFNSRLEL